MVASPGHPGLSKRPISRGKDLKPNSSHLSYVRPTKQCNTPQPVFPVDKSQPYSLQDGSRGGILLDGSPPALVSTLSLPHSELLAMKSALTPFGPLDLCDYYDWAWADSLSDSHTLRWKRSLECHHTLVTPQSSQVHIRT